jgi:hypothetical protein
MHWMFGLWDMLTTWLAGTMLPNAGTAEGESEGGCWIDPFG